MPVVPVVKPSGQICVCGDYKVTVNRAINVNQYPLPRMEDIFAKLAGGQKCSTIDLKSAYHQMEMVEEDRELLTLPTHKALFQYNRLPFGAASALAIWQRVIDQVFRRHTND